MLIKRRLGNSDIEISPIGLGCAQMSTTGMTSGVYPLAEAEEVVKASMAGGVNWFDTAEGYGGSEQALTTGLRSLGIKPGGVIIATKWLPMGRWASNISSTIEERIRSLQGYPIDLYQIHNSSGFSSVKSEMREMAKLFGANKIKAIGVSNFNAKQMSRAAEALHAEGLKLISNQIRISLLSRNFEKNGILETAKKLGVTLIAYAPLHAGILTGRFHDNPEAMKSTHYLRRNLMFGKASNLELTKPLIVELERIAKAYGVSRSQVALNWVISFYGDTVVAIPGASNQKQAKENAEVMEFQLTEKELHRLDDLSREAVKALRL